MEDEAVDARSTSRLGYTGLRDADRTAGKPKLPVNRAGVLVRERTQVDIDGPGRRPEIRSLVVGLLRRMLPLRHVVRVAHEVEDRSPGCSELSPLDLKCTQGRLLT